MAKFLDTTGVSYHLEQLIKKTKENLKQIKYKFTRDKLGGKNAYFYTENGIEFYEILLAFGE